MKWFKHYHNASSSLKLQALISELGVEGYGQYWLLLELLCEKFDGETPVVCLFSSEISAKVGIKFSKKLQTFVQKLADFSLISYEISGKVYKIDAPILLDLQSKDFKFATRQRQQNDSKTTLRIKNKNKEEDKEKEMNKEKIRDVAFFENAKPKINEHENFAQSVKFIVDLFNSEISTSSANKAFGIIGSKTTANLILLLEEEWFKTESNWIAYFNKIKQSDFLMGKSQGSRFVISLDWVVDPENAGKIMNGKYENIDKINAESFMQDALSFFKNKYGENL